MPDVVGVPPDTPLRADGSKIGGWWHRQDDGRVICDLCPRSCSLRNGDRGFCFVRENVNDQMVLTTYGRSTGFCVDPIEKKPLNHRCRSCGQTIPGRFDQAAGHWGRKRMPVDLQSHSSD